MNTPQSMVRLYNAPFDISYQHTRWFANKQEQNTYFTSGIAPLVTRSKVLYVRPEKGEVKVNLNREELLNINYLTFDNGNKTYFAFVTDVAYANENMAKIQFEIDVVQTYMFDMQFKQSFIEREHCDPNSINTVPESFDLGFEYEIKEEFSSNAVPKGLQYLVIACTEKLDGDVQTDEYSMGENSSLIYYLYPSYAPNFQRKSVKINGQLIEKFFENVNEVLQSEQNIGKVVSMNYIPSLPFEHSVTINGDVAEINSLSLALSGLGANFARILQLNFKEFNTINYTGFKSKLKNFGGITENKLLYYPYSYLTLTDNNGSVLDIFPQYLKGDNIDIKGKTIIDARYRSTYTVKDYRGNTGNSLETSLIDNIPFDLPIINDHTATYIQGNKNSVLTSTIGGIAGGTMGIIGGGTMLALGNPMGAVGMIGGVVSLGRTIAGTVAKVNDIKNIPDNLSKQTSNSMLNIVDGLFLPKLVVKQISKEKIEIIQSYLKAYGWATHRIKTPNLRTRLHFNYVQTVGANITGTIPKDNLDTLIKAFDKGITLWHVNDMFNYGLENGDR